MTVYPSAVQMLSIFFMYLILALKQRTEFFDPRSGVVGLHFLTASSISASHFPSRALPELVIFLPRKFTRIFLFLFRVFFCRHSLGLFSPTKKLSQQY